MQPNVVSIEIRVISSRIGLRGVFQCCVCDLRSNIQDVPIYSVREVFTLSLYIIHCKRVVTLWPNELLLGTKKKLLCQESQEAA